MRILSMWMVLALVSACSGGSGKGSNAERGRVAAESPAPRQGVPVADAANPCSGVHTQRGSRLVLEPVATGLHAPTYLVHSGDGTGRLFVTEQAGRIRVIGPRGNWTEWLDLQDRVSAGGEQGLLSIAFHPNFARNGRFFIYYTQGSGDVFLSEMKVPGDPRTARPDLGSERVLLEFRQRFSNHFGGQTLFGEDGFLYVGIGDGGSENDPDDNAQRVDSLLGKILRIDVDGMPPYGIPPDNPFVGRDGHRGEIWAMGFRNPWRFSFDRKSGQMWIGDVGRVSREEIDLGRAGANYGWKRFEGRRCNSPPCDADRFVSPVWEYANPEEGMSVVGGYVYRGCRLPDLEGQYLFSDYGDKRSPLWSLQLVGDEVTRGSVAIPDSGALISSFGEDEQGELYVVDHGGGRILRIVGAAAD